MAPGSVSQALESLYEVKQGRVGEGQFGVVLRAVHRETGRDVAVKYLVAAKPSFSKVIREIAILAVLQEAPQIVRLLDVARTARSQSWCLIFERAECDLETWLRARRDLHPVWQVLPIMEQLIQGLAALLASGVVHGDLKPRNVLVLADTRSPTIRVADLGEAFFPLVPPLPSARDLTTPAWRAPEVFLGGCGFPMDMWAAGWIAFELLVGLHPFAHLAERDVPDAIIHRRGFPGDAPDLRDLAQAMFPDAGLAAPVPADAGIAAAALAGCSRCSCWVLAVPRRGGCEEGARPEPGRPRRAT